MDSTAINHSEIKTEINNLINNFYNIFEKDTPTQKNKEFKQILSKLNIKISHNIIDKLFENKIDLKFIEDLYEKLRKTSNIYFLNLFTRNI